MESLVQWVAPAPLWAGFTNTNGNGNSTQTAFRAPTLLRFAADTFMEDFMYLLDAAPERLSGLRAAPETWRTPLAEPERVPEVPAFMRALTKHPLLPKPDAASLVTQNPAPPLLEAEGPLKLYQPAHQRHYLISACLVCRVPGLPDRTLNAGAQERASFVVRRLRPPGNTFDQTPDLATWSEYAFVEGEGGRAWQRVPAGQGDSVAGEERLPLFGVSFPEADRKRRLFAGNVPVAKRETYMAARVPALPGDAAAEPPPDPRLIVLRTEALEPWQRLVYQARDVADRHTTALNATLAEVAKAKAKVAEAKAEVAKAKAKVDEAKAEDDKAKLNTEYEKEKTALRKQITEGSWYVLLDFARVLKPYYPEVWAAVQDASKVGALDTAQSSLYQALHTIMSNGLRLTDALRRIVAYDAVLEAKTDLFNESLSGWPDFTFPLAAPDSGPADPNRGPTFPTGFAEPNDLIALFAAALRPADTRRVPHLPLAAAPPPDGRDPGWFIIRCVFDRPNCGALCPALVSAPTEPFQMAPFFDPDAPARPIRIALPIDTSPSGLRKFQKNTAFMISDTLSCQMKKLGKLTLGDLVLSVLPWPFHKDLPSDIDGPCDPVDIGMICSMSIPIITICALIILMIIVSLFNFIFLWLPMFIICFPFPKLKAKKA